MSNSKQQIIQQDNDLISHLVEQVEWQVRRWTRIEQTQQWMPTTARLYSWACTWRHSGKRVIDCAGVIANSFIVGAFDELRRRSHCRDS